MISRDRFVYWLSGAGGECLYVGMTQNPEQRLKVHQRRFGAEIAHRRMAGPYTEEVARRIERGEVDRLQPKYDAHSQRRRKTAAWLEQPIYTVTSAAELLGIPADSLAPYKFIRIPDDSEVAA